MYSYLGIQKTTMFFEIYSSLYSIEGSKTAKKKIFGQDNQRNCKVNRITLLELFTFPQSSM
jgi:hypothetical protein